MNIPIKTERKLIQIDNKAVQVLSLSILQDVSIKIGDQLLINSKYPEEAVILKAEEIVPQKIPYWARS